jgi:hypothetical protein
MLKHRFNTEKARLAEADDVTEVNEYLANIAMPG